MSTSETVEAIYMPAVVCPECGEVMWWEDHPEDMEHPREVRVTCTTPGCDHAGRQYSVRWPRVSMQEVVVDS